MDAYIEPFFYFTINVSSIIQKSETYRGGHKSIKKNTDLAKVENGLRRLLEEQALPNFTQVIHRRVHLDDEL